jgi:FMN phosphatase YigB (HAD superfamily)
MASLHHKPLFAFDWDDVILNTDKVRELCYNLPRLAGISDELNNKVIDSFKNNGGYNFRRHMRDLVRHDASLATVVPVLQRAFDDFFKHEKELLYRDAERIIQRLHGRYDLAVVTTGDPEFQQHKIALTGMARYFRHMLFVPEGKRGVPASKARALGQLLELYPKVFFFDDRVDTIGQAHDEHGHHGRLVPIRVDRKLQSTVRYPNIIRHFDEFSFEE